MAIMQTKTSRVAALVAMAGVGFAAFTFNRHKDSPSATSSGLSSDSHLIIPELPSGRIDINQSAKIEDLLPRHEAPSSDVVEVTVGTNLNDPFRETRFVRALRVAEPREEASTQPAVTK